MSARPKREVRRPPEKSPPAPKRFTDEELEIMFDCLLKYGHKDLEKLQEHLPNRSIENIKTFIRTVYDRAIKENKGSEILDKWIERCDKLEGTPWKDCIQIAQVLKYLSVDGLLEKHPSPQRSGGIDFGQAYRLLYQAMMGYPIQPVNQPTCDFVLESIAELNSELKKQTQVIKNVQAFVEKKPPTQDNKPNETKETKSTFEPEKKPLKVYGRKRTAECPQGEPSLKITIQEEQKDTQGPGKDFSVTVEGSSSSSSEATLVNVTVPCEKSVNANEEELLKSSSYNPFKIPGKWLEEPFYVNLLHPA